MSIVNALDKQNIELKRRINKTIGYVKFKIDLYGGFIETEPLQQIEIDEYKAYIKAYKDVLRKLENES